MYIVYYNNHDSVEFTKWEVLWCPEFDDLARTVYKLELTMEVNKSGTMKFYIGSKNPAFGKLVPLKTSILVLSVKEGKARYVWDGRVFAIENSEEEYMNVICEGALSYLLDSPVDTSVLDYTESNGTDMNQMGITLNLPPPIGSLSNEPVSITLTLEDLTSGSGDDALSKILDDAVNGLWAEDHPSRQDYYNKDIGPETVLDKAKYILKNAYGVSASNFSWSKLTEKLTIKNISLGNIKSVFDGSFLKNMVTNAVSSIFPGGNMISNLIDINDGDIMDGNELGNDEGTIAYLVEDQPDFVADLDHWELAQQRSVQKIFENSMTDSNPSFDYNRLVDKMTGVK